MTTRAPAVLIKARLVCRGFEEMVKVQADSPTGSKETLHMLLALAATNDWTVKSGDVKNAYLQRAQLDREVYMEAPAEAKKEGMVWKLDKAVYGMYDAGRRWFFKVEETLVKLGCVKSKYDHCLFTYRQAGQLAGIILLWVDDIFHAGSKEFEEKVMTKIHNEFLIGRTAEETFPTKLLFPKISGKFKIISHSNAGFHNLPDKISSGRGHIIFLEGDDGRAAPLGWTCNKVKRVVGSTVAAEALSN